MAEMMSAKSGPNDYQELPQFKAIMAEIRSYGEFTSKSVESAPVAKTISAGERAVEEAKARNRAKLKGLYEEDKKRAEQKDDLAAWKEQVKSTQAEWKKEVAQTLSQWKEEQDIFLGRIKAYKANTFKLPVKEEKIVEKSITLEAVPDVHIVHAAFKVPMRDQKNRPTCSAFAGIRAVEILLAQHARDQDLSEQYFYWASKPNCQGTPCTEKGSWVTPGLRHSQNQSMPDLPVETRCVYSAVKDEKNETQVPLSAECKEGVAKIVSYEEVRTLAEAIEKIKQDVPVIIGAKLSENFYRNNGLVRVALSSGNEVKLDSHSKGHTFLGVGVIELPEKLWKEEGSFCIVVANSWGEGWGAGGYSCLSEKWMLKFRQSIPLVAVTKVQVK